MSRASSHRRRLCYACMGLGARSTCGASTAASYATHSLEQRGGGALLEANHKEVGEAELAGTRLLQGKAGRMSVRNQALSQDDVTG